MSALKKSQTENSGKKNVTAIDVNARIDYVLRFSQQAIIVIDEDKDVCSKVCHQFLACQADTHNAAFITANNKLNDIQIRCRIIEQLFSNVLFDPEHSLTKTIISFAKSNPKIISIVIESAEDLSLQLVHELCQVGVAAKKLNLSINVILTANKTIGYLFNKNITLFNNQLTVLSAETGQLIPLNSRLFNESSHFFELTLGKKISAGLLTISLLSFVAIYGLLEVNVNRFSEQASISGLTDETLSLVATTFKAPLIKNDEVVSNKDNKAEKTGSSIPPVETENLSANSRDIFVAINDHGGNNTSIGEPRGEITPANASDILNALTPLREGGIEPKLAFLGPLPEASSASDINTMLTGIFTYVDPSYYQELSEGFVIQISAYVDQGALDRFLLANRDRQFYRYLRSYNDRPLLVLTSEMIATKEEALSYRNQLANDLNLDNLFIKSIKTVNNEINLYQSSQ